MSRRWVKIAEADHGVQTLGRVPASSFFKMRSSALYIRNTGSFMASAAPLWCMSVKPCSPAPQTSEHNPGEGSSKYSIAKRGSRKAKGGGKGFVF